MIVFLFVGCGYNLYYWQRIAENNAKQNTPPTINDEPYYQEEQVYDDTLTNDTVQEYYYDRY